QIHPSSFILSIHPFYLDGTKCGQRHVVFVDNVHVGRGTGGVIERVIGIWLPRTVKNHDIGLRRVEVNFENPVDRLSSCFMLKNESYRTTSGAQFSGDSVEFDNDCRT